LFFWRLSRFARCLLRVKIVEAMALSWSKTPSAVVSELRFRMGMAVPRLAGAESVVGAGPAATETARVTARRSADLLNMIMTGWIPKERRRKLEMRCFWCAAFIGFGRLHGLHQRVEVT
jgi:hypothetical protein